MEFICSRTQVPYQQPGAHLRESLGPVASRDLPILTGGNSLATISFSVG